MKTVGRNRVDMSRGNDVNLGLFYIYRKINGNRRSWLSFWSKALLAHGVGGFYCLCPSTLE